MIETLIISNQHQVAPNVIALSDTLLNELNLTNNTKMSIIKYNDGRIELIPIEQFPKGDIRRLKGMVKTNIQSSIQEMNEAIATGAVYGE